MPPIRVPKYRKRPDRNIAFVEIGGKRITLPGGIDSPESIAAYEQIVRDTIRRQSAAAVPRLSRFLAVADLIEKYLDYAKAHYFQADARRGEYANLRDSLRVLAHEHGGTLADSFGPLALKEVQASLIAANLARSTINDRVQRIKRMFRWGVANELVRPETYHALAAVEGIRKGQSAAKETAPVAPAPRGDVEAILPYLTPLGADMVRVHLLTGMRSSNLCAMRWADIDQGGKIWLYRPARHKGTNAEKMLVIPLGPKCQAILQKYLERRPEEFFFSPAESERQRRAAQRKARKTPQRAGNASKPPKANPKPRGRKGSRYTPDSYRRMIWRAIEKANTARAKCGQPAIPHWHPHQLRHTVATEIRQKYKAEAARVFLGHARLSVTEIYAERDLALAERIAQEMG